jgi:3',5'-cyclic AMP phosphodiesterase CpdA
VTADRRVLHLSDIHFGPNHLPEVSSGIAALVEAERPDLVIVSGDLTLRAKPHQFREARSFVERLERTAPVLAVPGNHDVPLWRVWERLLVPYGAYRRHFRDELEPVYRDEKLLVVGLNTSQAWAFKGGRARRRGVERAARLFEEVPADSFRILVAHHHLAVPEGVDCEHASWNGRWAAERLERAGVDLVLSGHLHQTLELYPAGPGGFPALHTGTSSSSRGRGPETAANTLQWIAIGRERFDVRGLRFDAARGAFATAFDRPYVRRRER